MRRPVTADHLNVRWFRFWHLRRESLHRSSYGFIRCMAPRASRRVPKNHGGSEGTRPRDFRRDRATVGLPKWINTDKSACVESYGVIVKKEDELPISPVRGHHYTLPRTRLW